MTSTGTTQAGPQPHFMSPVIAAALLAVTVLAGVWFATRDSGDDTTATAEAPAAMRTTAGAPTVAGSAASTVARVSREAPVVYIVATEPAADVLRAAFSDTGGLRESSGELPRDARVLALPVDADPEVLFAEERRFRDYEGLPQFDVVDLRLGQTTLEGITP